MSAVVFISFLLVPYSQASFFFFGLSLTPTESVSCVDEGSTNLLLATIETIS